MCYNEGNEGRAMVRTALSRLARPALPIRYPAAIFEREQPREYRQFMEYFVCIFISYGGME